MPKILFVINIHFRMNLNTQRNSESITNNMARAKAERQTLGAKTGDANQV